MGYKEYKPDSVDKVVIDEIDIEVQKFTDKDNFYFCSVCEKLCDPEFYYVNDAPLCTDECKDKYLDIIRENQESDGTKQMQGQLDKEIKDAIAQAQAQAQAQTAAPQPKRSHHKKVIPAAPPPVVQKRSHHKKKV
jgi:hypothetical protein